MPRLNKADSRKRWRELRDLWNEYDPIGIMDDPDSPLDEYESYLGPCLRLLEQKVIANVLEAQVRAALENMGLQDDDASIHSFVVKMQNWFRTNWESTTY